MCSSVKGGTGFGRVFANTWRDTPIWLFYPQGKTTPRGPSFDQGLATPAFPDYTSKSGMKALAV
jgi:hypothetical protein